MFTYLKLSDSLIADATLTPETEVESHEAFPVANVAVEPVSKVWRTAANQKLLIDFDEPVTVDLFAVVNHSLTDGATITLRGGSSQDPDGMDFELVIPWARRNAWAIFDAAETWQHWSLTIDDSFNPESAIEIGLLLLGEKTELSRNFNFGSETRRETLNQSLESEYRVVTTGAKLYQGTRFVASWKTENAAQRGELDAFLRDLEKERNGLLFIPYPDEAESWYGRFMSDYTIVRTSPDIAEVNALEFLEDGVGGTAFSLF